jgi:hypothetical protein
MVQHGGEVRTDIARVSKNWIRLTRQLVQAAWTSPAWTKLEGGVTVVEAVVEA